MEEIKYGKLIITEKDREFSKTIDGNNFTVSIPLPIQKATIIAQTSRALGGMNVNSFLPEDYEYIRKIITLNSVIVDHPKWWDGADSCPDDSLIDILWNFFLASDVKFQKFLKKNTGEKKSKQPSNDD